MIQRTIPSTSLREKTIGVTFPNYIIGGSEGKNDLLGGGGSAGEKCSMYHQNPDENGYRFRFAPFFLPPLGGGLSLSWGVQSNMGGGHSQRDIKLRPWRRS